MKRVIGLVSEGPRDVDLITSVIENLFPDDQFEYRYLQPDVTLMSDNYNGWKDVLRWCRKDYAAVCSSTECLKYGMDLIIVQIDGDVSRKRDSKQSHCNCVNCDCPEREHYREGERYPFEECTRRTTECPLPFPCTEHQEEKPNTYVVHLKEILNAYLGERRSIPVLLLIPCDSMDTWIVAAYEDLSAPYELLEDPWDTIVARGKEYHGIRIHGKKKSKAVFNELIKTVTANWSSVTEKCSQAGRFQEELITAFQR
ncbi:MAG: hypothetical protein IJ088_04205 [Clostridia bacterium]|nr:hypothetical protein [Clostridia bacterium]